MSLPERRAIINHNKGNLSWWDYVAAAFQTIRLIWKYGPQGAKEYIDNLNIEVTKELNRLKYKP